MLSKTQQKYIVRLQDKKFREKEGRFISEGKKIISEILNSSLKIDCLYASEEFIRQHEDVLLKKNIKHLAVSKVELKKISCLKEPDDALLVCQAIKSQFDLNSIGEKLVVYLDEIRDPGNLGTIIRVCDWFNIHGIICSPGTAELYNPKTIQSSMGSFIRVPLIYKELKEILNEFRNLSDKRIPVYGAFTNGKNVYSEDKLEPGILVIGNEATGISEKNKTLINERITIPRIKKNGPESLNAAIATSLIIAEFTRRG